MLGVLEFQMRFWYWHCELSHQSLFSPGFPCVCPTHPHWTWVYLGWYGCYDLGSVFSSPIDSVYCVPAFFCSFWFGLNGYIPKLLWYLFPWPWPMNASFGFGWDQRMGTSLSYWNSCMPPITEYKRLAIFKFFLNKYHSSTLSFTVELVFAMGFFLKL